MRRIAALVFPGFELLDLFGPLQMFGMLDADYSLTLVGAARGPVASGQGPAAHAEHAFADGDSCDILFVPGGMGTRAEVQSPDLLGWIARASAQAELTLSVCTGAALLARAGVLDGRRATTNKAAFPWVISQGPAVTWVPRARWVQDGAVFTSSGVSAGIDMALGTIAALQGTATARKVAAWAEYTWSEDSTLDPFSRPHGLS